MRLFVRCKACHVVDATTNRVGPHLVGLFGRHAGEVEGFNYSDAMKNAARPLITSGSACAVPL